MEHQAGYFNGPRGHQIYHQAWLPEDKLKGILLVIHGLAEHCGRYMNVVNYFNPRGFAVYGLDQIGHGKSEGARVYVKRFDDFTSTINTYYKMIRTQHPGVPIFILGHSMGSLITGVHLLDHQEDFAGAIISGTMVKVPDHVTPVTIVMGKVFSALLPKLGIVEIDADHISSDRAVVDAYVNDPLVYRGKTTARLAAEMLAAMQRFSAQGSRISLPMTIVQGGNDKLVNVSDCQILFDLVSSSDKTVKVYEGFDHEVFNEPGRETVFADILDWLEERIS